MPKVTLIHGDCLEEMKKMESNSVDSICCDPPYGLSFMGKKWDYDVPSEDVWRECLRVLKPGGHLLAFAGTRTQHRMAVRIEDAGFEIRDMIAWIYSTGFPKSLNIAKAINKIDGVEFDEVPASGVGFMNAEGEGGYNVTKNQLIQKGESSERAKQWEGWGTALKPALEPITVARKPLIGTVAENVLTHGTGGINIDGCRVEGVTKHNNANGVFAHSGNGKEQGQHVMKNYTETYESNAGRFPANLIHDGSEEVVGLFPETKKAGNVKESDITAGASMFGIGGLGARNPAIPGDNGGSASRFFKECNDSSDMLAEMESMFTNDSDYNKQLQDTINLFKKENNYTDKQRLFYCAKASKKDRDEGLEGFAGKYVAQGNQAQAELKRGNIDFDGSNKHNNVQLRKNHHPTVKPTDLMRYLCRLVTPPGGIVLDPFMGSGSTGKAAVKEGFSFIGIEREAEYIEIAQARINACTK